VHLHAEGTENDHDGEMEKIRDSDSEAEEYADYPSPVIAISLDLEQ
jgi:hypothetical protein